MGGILVAVLLIGVFVGLSYIPGRISSVSLLQHPRVTVSGSVTMTGTDNPTQITFTDVEDIANSASSQMSSSAYAVTVANGHSYNIAINYSTSYKTTCHSYSPLDCQGDSNTDCRFDYVENNGYSTYGVYTCTHFTNAVCRGGPLKVNVAADIMTFNIQCT